MAKLDGVKVVNETVEYNEFVYTLVTGDAKVEDIVKASEQELDVTEGAFYLVVDIDDDNDIVFKDNVDDSNYFNQGEHSVFRKSHVITTDKLTDAEGVVTITLPDGTKLEGTPSDLEKITRSMQKMQNEQQGQAEQVVAEEEVEVEYEDEPVSERLQVGDYVKVIAHDDNGQSKFGDIVKVTEDDESDIPFDTKHLDGSYAGWHYEKDLVRATEAEVKAVTEPKVEPLKVGDFAKLISTNFNTNADLNEIVVINVVDKTGIPYGIKNLNGEEIGWAPKDHLVKATDEEVLEAKQALLKEGDFARVIANTSNHRFEIGTVVNLKSHNSNTKSFSAYYLDGSDFWGVYSKDLEPLTKEETEHIAREGEEEKKAKAERAKWAAIGREVGEIKKGDIVRTVSHCGSVNPVGTIGVAREDSTVYSCSTVALAGGSGNWSRVELIVPVEQRFDTVG
ncbi:TPA: hypothetical protein ACTZ5S_001743 [Bacillus cereus]|uniref:hypothetical protein n=1 Tax=Bacillus TaxID=1386 RepID=UPI000884BCCB|nr:MULTISPECIES: hypothetical protein [Bacillus]ASK14434.1 hypothetical protein BA201_11205 [Bacillus cereus]MCU5251824.1 hypothetical protein [Bacillus cereus]MDZ4428407.1 hypothetical protein [Bacillus cereus]MDZ4464075.1 hypothetical protein [Bacillus cereus]MDZ4512750.1 hypothetical protein [Bacillus cereus]